MCATLVPTLCRFMSLSRCFETTCRFLAMAALLGASNIAPAAEPDDQEFITRLAERVAYVLQPPADIKTLEYDFSHGGPAAPVKVAQGDRRPLAVWQGMTLHGGLHELLRAPQKFDISIERPADAAGAITIRGERKADAGVIEFHAGNGIENSWSGYFSYGARQTTITVDATRLVPLKEETGNTTVLYEDWIEAKPGRWVPQRIDVVNRSSYGGDAHYRMHFNWLADSIWLLRYSESISSDSAKTRTRVSNVRVNGQPAPQAESEEERRWRAAGKEVLAMLEHNRLWLDLGAFAGGEPPFETLSYSFHTEREDVREQCILDRTGAAAIEVVHDGKGKMKEQLGARQVSLNTGEFATSRRGAHFAWLHSRPKRLDGEPFDLALKRYARIGCQFDLPLFRYRERMDGARVEMADAQWNGVACRAVTLGSLGRDAVLGCGTMLGFSSWSYVHHIRPNKEVLYVDPRRNVPLHDTLTSGDKTFEIDFLDYVEPAPGQWAPLFIRIESPGYFTCEYRFQIVAGRHWMLKEVVSWFDPANKSRGVIEEIRLNAGRELLEESLAQADAARKLFAGEGEPRDRVTLPAAPFRLGEEIAEGPYRLRFTWPERHRVAIDVSTSDLGAPSRFPVCIFDEHGAVLFAPTVELADKEGKRQGRVELRASRVWNAARFVSVPGSPAADGAGRRIETPAIPFRWQEALPINATGLSHGWGAAESAHKVGTRAFRVQVDRTQQGSARAKLDVVSIDGPKEFYLDLSLALVGRDHELLAAGRLETKLLVESEAVEKQFEIDLGAIPAGKEPEWLILGVAPGTVTSMPLGTLWGALALAPPFDIATTPGAADQKGAQAFKRMLKRK